MLGLQRKDEHVLERLRHARAEVTARAKGQRHARWRSQHSAKTQRHTRVEVTARAKAQRHARAEVAARAKAQRHARRRSQHVPRPGSEETGAGARSGAAQGKAGLPARIIQPQRAFFPEMAEAASDRSQQEGWAGAGCVCRSTARRAKRADTAARMRKLQAWGRAADRGAANGSVGVINAPEQKLTEGDGRAGYGR